MLRDVCKQRLHYASCSAPSFPSKDPEQKRANNLGSLDPDPLSAKAINKWVWAREQDSATRLHRDIEVKKKDG